ncbi:unnamed protein product [Adineta steineri]|uniref:Uncharacterized protein n=1 Tax=Adineta steineri TaxID=433720 RepID=A0A819W5K6_9BILA|nr:unnamed protein product [Adineta steineri]CAF1327770.1 unnamed protein product [Adineta steineri]CAF4119400.1 unnamed protein product [Adineta steineri]
MLLFSLHYLHHLIQHGIQHPVVLYKQCFVNSNNNNNNSCLSSSTPCFDYRTTNNISYCAPGILCSILETCNNITQTCSSNNSICIVNSCCSSKAVCLPFSATQICKSGTNAYIIYILNSTKIN